MSAARTVIRSNGRAYRVALLQPPHYRKGRDAPAVDRAALDAVRAITASGIERTAHYRSKGVRVITTK
jgi:hypothetical protein